jgi:hypothetical protein
MAPTGSRGLAPNKQQHRNVKSNHLALQMNSTHHPVGQLSLLWTPNQSLNNKPIEPQQVCHPNKEENIHQLSEKTERNRELRESLAYPQMNA